MNYVKLGWFVRHVLEVALIIWIGFKASLPVTIFCALVLIRFWIEDAIKIKQAQIGKAAAEELFKQMMGPHGPSD